MTTDKENTMPEATQKLLDAIQENLSPHAVALIAAKLRPGCARGELGREAERQCQWLADRLVELLGRERHEQLCTELDL